MMKTVARSARLATGTRSITTNANGWYNATTRNAFNSLPSNKTILEYVWIGGTGQDIRSKIKITSKNPSSAADLPAWNYDGSSTDQAPGENSEIILQPKAMYPHPFHPNHNAYVVMCDTYNDAGEAIETNTRAPANAIFEQITEKYKPMFAFEQEYSLFYNGTHLGFPEHGYPAPQGPYYCGNGANAAYGREVADAHLHAMLYAGLGCSGTNAEVMAGQWEFQIGPVVGVEAGDQLWIGRWALHRVGELYGVQVDFDPKTKDGDWNGAGCHTNFCIKDFHLPDGKGMENILKVMPKFEAKHLEHIKAYGEGNERRLTGLHETQHIGTFSYGVADRGSSIRIPRHTSDAGRGYIEDRRPASNCDPYVVSSKIMETMLL